MPTLALPLLSVEVHRSDLSSSMCKGFYTSQERVYVQRLLGTTSVVLHNPSDVVGRPLSRFTGGATARVEVPPYEVSRYFYLFVIDECCGTLSTASSVTCSPDLILPLHIK